MTNWQRLLGILAILVISIASLTVVVAAATPCTNSANCNDNADSVSGNVETGCVCTCKIPYTGESCNLCAADYLPLLPTAPPMPPTLAPQSQEQLDEACAHAVHETQESCDYTAAVASNDIDAQLALHIDRERTRYRTRRYYEADAVVNETVEAQLPTFEAECEPIFATTLDEEQAKQMEWAHQQIAEFTAKGHEEMDHNVTELEAQKQESLQVWKDAAQETAVDKAAVDAEAWRQAEITAAHVARNASIAGGEDPAVADAALTTKLAEIEAQFPSKKTEILDSAMAALHTEQAQREEAMHMEIEEVKKDLHEDLDRRVENLIKELTALAQQYAEGNATAAKQQCIDTKAAAARTAAQGIEYPKASNDVDEYVMNIAAQRHNHKAEMMQKIHERAAEFVNAVRATDPSCVAAAAGPPPPTPAPPQIACEPRACQNSSNCHGHATSVSGDVVNGCTCECQPGYTGGACNSCAENYTAFGTIAPTPAPTTSADAEAACQAAIAAARAQGLADIADAKTKARADAIANLTKAMSDAFVASDVAVEAEIQDSIDAVLVSNSAMITDKKNEEYNKVATEQMAVANQEIQTFDEEAHKQKDAQVAEAVEEKERYIHSFTEDLTEWAQAQAANITEVYDAIAQDKVADAEAAAQEAIDGGADPTQVDKDLAVTKDTIQEEAAVNKDMEIQKVNDHANTLIQQEQEKKDQALAELEAELDQQIHEDRQKMIDKLTDSIHIVATQAADALEAELKAELSWQTDLSVRPTKQREADVKLQDTVADEYQDAVTHQRDAAVSASKAALDLVENVYRQNPACVAGWMPPPLPAPEGVDCHPTLCTNAENCNSNADNVTGDLVNGCTCTCKAGYAGTMCDSCAANYSGYPLAVPPVPCAPKTCVNAANCNGNAENVSGDVVSGCSCSCKTGYSDSNCGSCAMNYTGSPLAVPPVPCVPQQCSDVANCNGNANNVTGDIVNGCTCSCKAGYSGSMCDACAANFTGSPLANPAMPCTPVLCSNAANCNGHASNAEGNVVDGCTCTCKSGYAGATCNECAANHTGSPMSVPPVPCIADSCTGTDCNGNEDAVNGDRVIGCTCSCKTGYAGSRCGECAANYTGSPLANPAVACTPVQCSSAANCNGNAESVTGDIVNGCTCTCKAGYAGPSCELQLTTAPQTTQFPPTTGVAPPGNRTDAPLDPTGTASAVSTTGGPPATDTTAAPSAGPATHVPGTPVTSSIHLNASSIATYFGAAGHPIMANVTGTGRRPTDTDLNSSVTCTNAVCNVVGWTTTEAGSDSWFALMLVRAEPPRVSGGAVSAAGLVSACAVASDTCVSSNFTMALTAPNPSVSVVFGQSVRFDTDKQFIRVTATVSEPSGVPILAPTLQLIFTSAVPLNYEKVDSRCRAQSLQVTCTLATSLDPVLLDVGVLSDYSGSIAVGAVLSASNLGENALSLGDYQFVASTRLPTSPPPSALQSDVEVVLACQANVDSALADLAAAVNASSSSVKLVDPNEVPSCQGDQRPVLVETTPEIAVEILDLPKEALPPSVVSASAPTNTGGASAEDSGSGAVIGGVVGGVIALLLLLALAVYFVKRKDKQHARSARDAPAEGEAPLLQTAATHSEFTGARDAELIHVKASHKNSSDTSEEMWASVVNLSSPNTAAADSTPDAPFWAQTTEPSMLMMASPITAGAIPELAHASPLLTARDIDDLL